MNVALYIYNDKYVNTGGDGITADTTLITADNAFITADNEPLGGFEGFVEVAQRIELFDKEKINLTSSIQDIMDISKAKTDFTQSFTVPASKKNNIIFKHWYESAVDGGFDQRIKYRGFIEIDTIPFRTGGLSLSNVKFKDGKPQSYTINFFGDAKSIKDILKEDKLSSLDFTDLNHSYTPTEVINRITSSSADVAYPLFAHDRLYSYNDASATDITTNTGAIEWNTLFPAVSAETIFDKIFDKYGLEFTGAFRNYIQFSKLWMLFKNSESLVVPTAPLKVDFTSKTGGTDNEINLTTDEIGFDIGSGGYHRILKILIIPTDNTISYDVLIYKNGVLFNSFTGQLGTSINTFLNGFLNTQSMNDKYTIEVQSEIPMTFTSTLYYRVSLGSDFQAIGTSQTTQSVINIGRYAPDLKLADFIYGLMKAFNLVFIPNSATSFEIIPLELYYNNGKFNDISANVISDDWEIRKTSMYKNINFKYQSSENVLNNRFNELFTPQRGFNYGDLTYEQIDSLESSTFTVDLPFENPIYERKSDSNFLTITFKNKDLNNYVPKPLLMYDNGLETLGTAIKISTGSFVNVTSYRRFSNDIDNGGLLTLNWGEEVSQWFLNVASNGLYKRHYENYLGNIFDIKGRLFNVKCKFNPVQLSNIALNDRVVIRDKRYTINKLNCDLTTGEADLELLTDYRTGEVSIGNRYSYQDFYQVGNEPQNIEVLLLTAGYDEIIISTPDVAWLDVAETSYFDNTTIAVKIEPNSQGLERVGNILGRWANSDGTFVDVEIPIIQGANLNFTNTTVRFDNNNLTFDNDGTTTS